MFKQMFAVVLSVLLMACHSVNNEPVQQEQPVITGQTRISLTGSFESLRTADGLRSLGFFMPGSSDWGSEESRVSLSFGAEASHPAVLIVRNKQTKETHRKLVRLTKLGSEGLKFKIEDAFVFDNVATPFSEGDWSVMIVTAGRPDLVKEEVSGGTKTYKVWGEAFLDNCRSSEGDEVLTATSLPYASEWVDLTIQAGRSQAEAKADIVLRPFGTVFAVVINGIRDKRYNGTVANGWGASSNYIPRSGYFDLSDDALPEIGTLGFPRWVNHELLNTGGGTYSKEPLFNERVADDDPDWRFRRKPTFTENVYYKYWLFVFPVGEELPEVDDPVLKLAVRYGDRLENRTPETWTKKHKVFWSSNGNSPLSELRGRIIESVNVTL